jgi:hypothetical protein
MKTTTGMKRRMALFVAVIMTLTLWTAVPLPASALTDGDFEYSVSSNKATITGYTGSGGDIIIPDKVGENVPVTAIGGSAFLNNTTLTSVEIQSGVTTINSSAFNGCTALASVTIPDTVKTFGSSVFRDTALTTITIPTSVTTIGNYTFYGCTSLTSVVVPDSVTSLGTYTFNRCTSLTSVTLPNAITSLGEYTFNGCTALISVTIPSTVETIGNSAFRASALTSVTIPSSVKTIGNSVFRDSALTSIVIPNTVTSMGTYTFYGCSSLISVTLSNAATSLGEYTFYGCSLLTSVAVPNGVMTIGNSVFRNSGLISIAIPASVTTIGTNVFLDSTSLTAITVDGNNNDYKDETGVLFTKDGTTIVCYPAGRTNATYTIPDGVEAFGRNSFSHNTFLTSVTIPSSVTSQDGSLFNDCISLATIYVNGGTTYKSENGVLFSADGSTLLRYPPAKAGTSYTIPHDITSLDVDAAAFTNCTSLTAFDVEQGNTAYTSIDGVLFTLNEETLVRYPSGKADIKNYTVPDGVTSLAKNAFRGNASLTSVALSSDVTGIAEWAFNDCSALTSVIIPNAATTFASSTVFVGCNFDKLKLWCHNSSTVQTYATSNSIAYGLLLDSIDATDTALNTGASKTLSVSYLPEITNIATETPAITWASSDSDTVAVNTTTGRVTGIAEGSATITATAISLSGEEITDTCTVTVDTAIATIISFTLAGLKADIDMDGSITVNLPANTNVTNLTPVIVHNGVSIDPPMTAAQNFMDPVIYTVTDGGTTNNYTVTATVAPAPPAQPATTNDITSFMIGDAVGNVSGNTITVEVPSGTDITALAPTIGINGVSVNPASGVEKDFTNPVTYTVTSESGVTKTYTVTVSVANVLEPPVVTTGWIYKASAWYLYDVDGQMLTGWHYIDKNWYYLAANGAMQTGWLYDQNKWYYLAGNGAMKVSWAKVDGSWYYLRGNGAMIWSKWLHDIDDSWYYLSGNGKMLTGKQNIGGKTYTFKGNGVWVS